MTTKRKKTAAPRLRRDPSGRLGYFLGRSPQGVQWWVYPTAGETQERLAGRIRAQLAGLVALNKAHAKLAKPKAKGRRR